MDAEAPNREMTLNGREVRVLGCLVEKALSTPDYYPMTVNALTAACNQKTNRDPVVEYTESDVVAALDALRRKRLVGNASSAHARAPKHRHALTEAVGLDRPHLAVLASLFLRGPETSGELRARTVRMHPFESLDEVDAVLEELESWDPPLVAPLPRRPGQKEARYAHLFSGSPDEASAPSVQHAGDSERVEALEEEVAGLKTALRDLSERFEAFRAQFE